MTTFTDFKKAVAKQWKSMQAAGQLFVTDIDKDELCNLYLNSFPEGTNLVYRERREYDCNCCKQFIRAVGGVVAIDEDNNLISLWDIQVGGYYQPVVEALSAYVKNKAVANEFFHFERTAGTDKTYDTHEAGKEWQHFYVKIPNQYFKPDSATTMSASRSNKEVLMRSFEELSLSSAEIVLELIDQNSLYRGAEHKATVKTFVKNKKLYDKVPEEQCDNFCWKLSKQLGGSSKFRNTVIGTLLSDISEGVELEKAVKKFEAKVAPANYKRPTALITQSMIKKAQSTVQDLGLEPSLSRRYATAADLTINNVLFADRSTQKNMQGGVFDDLLNSTPVKAPKLDRVQEMSVEDFIKNVVPTATTIEMFLENKHTSNLMSVIAPQEAEAPNLMKWGNNFSWTYNGEVADSDLRQQVAARGGSVSGVLRFSHTWNYDGNNQSLMDLHVFMPGCGYVQSTGNEVHDNYPRGQRVGWNQRTDGKSGGVQDVDFVDPPGKNIPVENITFPSIDRMPEGEYIFKIHNWDFRNRTTSGFKAEIEFGGEIYEYFHPQPVKNKQWVTLAKVQLKNGKFEIEHLLKPESASKEAWNLSTQNWHKVSMIMNSPNHWDGEETGNKHTFFILDGCRNDEPARGFYNEFLSNDLTEHRKVFEVLGNKMKTPESEEQLSGVGFSSTVRNQVTLKVTGKTNRVVNVTF